MKAIPTVGGVASVLGIKCINIIFLYYVCFALWEGLGCTIEQEYKSWSNSMLQKQLTTGLT